MGVVSFDEMVIPHVRGFPLAPWEAHVREAPLDPRAQPEYVERNDEYDEFEAQEDDYIPDDYVEEDDYVPDDYAEGYLEGGYGYAGSQQIHGYGYQQNHWYDPHEDVYEPMPKRRKRVHTKRASRVSVDTLLNNTSGLTQEYIEERKAFYEDLEKFHGSMPDVNMLSGQPIDLYHLYIHVMQRGGYKEVNHHKRWADIYRGMPQYTPTHTSASNALKRAYRKNLLPYEEAQAENDYPEDNQHQTLQIPSM